jgi:hypothetical protein
LGLFLIFLLFFSSYFLRENFLNFSNPLNIFSYLLNILSNEKIILFLIIILIGIFTLYFKFHNDNFINEIFNDLIIRLKYKTFNNEEGLTENEIINIYCEKYGIDYDYFLDNYFNSLEKLREKNPRIKKTENLINGKNTFVWFYSDS